MAGSPRALIGPVRQRRPALLIAGLLFIVGVAASAETLHTLLLVEHPDRFVLLNKYQQHLTSAEYRGLPAIMLMVVVREDDKLSDGLAPCASVEIDGSPFYIQRDISGGFTRRGAGGSITLFRGALLLGDTVALRRGRALRLKAAGTDREMTLVPGSRAVRLFEAEGRTFVRVLPYEEPKGWLALSVSTGTDEWNRVQTSRSHNTSAENVVRRLLPVVADANRALHAVFMHLAAEAGENSTPPSFRLREDDDALRCAIEPQSLNGSFAGSLRKLLPEFERALLGTGLRPLFEGGSIVVPLR
jgi:hypothetical protein